MLFGIKGRKSDYLLTFVTEFTILIAGLLVYRYANVRFGELGFSEYALTRRSLSFIQPIVILGLAVGLPRYVAISESQSDYKKSGSYFAAALSILLSFLIISITILLIFKGSFAWILFGDRKYAGFILPLAIMLFGISIHGLSYSYFRGKIKMYTANLLQFLNLGIMMLIPFFISNDLISVLYYTGIGWTIVSIIFLLKIIFSIQIQTKILLSQVKELLYYGAQRVPGDAGLAALLALPAFFAAHYFDVKTAGYIAFGVSLLNMSGAAFSPISLILLPESSALIAQNKFKELKSKVFKIIKAVLILTIPGVVIFELFTGFILKIYLKEVSPELILISRVVMISSLGYSLFIALRSVVDAYYIKAINTRNILISLLIYLGMVFLLVLLKLQDVSWQVGALAIPASFLGVLTIFEIIKITKQNQIK